MTLRAELLAEVANYLDAADQLGGTATDHQRQAALNMIVARVDVARTDYVRRRLLVQLAVDALLYALQIDERHECRLDVGDEAA